MFFFLLLSFAGEVIRVWPGVSHQQHTGADLQCLCQTDSQRWVTVYQHAWVTLRKQSPWFHPWASLNSFAILLFMRSGKKPISRVLHSPTTYRYEDQDVLINKTHALGHHSTVGLAGLAYPDQTKPIPLRATSFFFSFTPSFISLHLYASFSCCYGFFFFLPPTKKVWNSIYLLPDGAWKRFFFFCCRKIHCRLRKEGLKRWDELYGRLWKIQG